MANYHFDHHRREALVTSRRFAFLNALIVAVLVVAGGYAYYRATHAAGVTGGHHSECEANNPSATTVTPGQHFTAYVQLYNDGSTNWSSDYGTYPGGYPDNTWQASGPGFPAGAGIPPGGRYAGTFNVVAPSTPGQYQMSWAVWIVFTGYMDNVCPAKTITVANPASPPPPRPVVTLTANSQNTNITVQKGGALTLAWSATNAPTSCTASGSWSGGKSGSGSENHTGDTASIGTKDYTLTCSNAGGSGAVTRSVTVTQPPPTPTPTPTPTPSPKPGSGGSGSSKPPSSTPSASTPSASTPATPDTTPPSKPDNFAATLSNDGSTVILTWNTASDDHGIKGYFLERSLDQQKWDTLADADKLALTSYTDSATSFNVHYFYRVRAVDTSGNQSDTATTDVTTGAFSANATNGTASQVQSADGLITATIPSDALAADASCSLVDDPSNKSALAATKLVLASGPYQLVCKDASGNSIDSFKSNIAISIVPGNKAFSKLTDLKIYGFDDSTQSWQALKTTLDKKTHVLSAQVNKPLQVTVLGSLKKGLPANLVFGVIFVILIIVAIIIFRIRQSQKAQYAEYMRRKYYNF